jgi:hypothetical protein
MFMISNNIALPRVTGTLIQTSTEDVERLLTVVEGPRPETRNIQGFVSCFLHRPAESFPRTDKPIHEVSLRDSILHKYLEKHKEFAKKRVPFRTAQGGEARRVLQHGCPLHALRSARDAARLESPRAARTEVQEGCGHPAWTTREVCRILPQTPG